MNPAGMYDGWTTHKAILTPVFGSYALRLTGKDRAGIKDYIAETLGAALDARVCYDKGDGTPEGFRVVPAPENARVLFAEGAACLWEAVLDADPTGDARADGWKGAMRRAGQSIGAAGLRSLCVRLAGDLESGWHVAAGAGFDSPFDWEFCPAFAARCVDWEAGRVVPDWLEHCRDIGRADAMQAESV
ncbi:hypothetical protein ACM25O_13340 [Sulfitobacter pontiacus]